MSIELFTAFVLFALVTSVTPGPNNLMLMASGANFGFRRTGPHMLGVSIGFSGMVILVGIGLMQLFDAYPVSYKVLKIAAVFYLGWLAWRIAMAGEPGKGRTGAVPLTFLQACAFQWVNPKAWAMALTSITAYAPTRDLMAVAFVALVFGAINLPSVSLWTLMGQQIRRLLTNHTRLRLFNATMAVLLLASLYPVVFA